ncbi:MAG: pyridoxal-phosphate dependent enzyme [Streptosporangiales bacterium]|nr:pyridoxal-phosphate dependent enzyme [Streptosporangiales bacterium]
MGERGPAGSRHRHLSAAGVRDAGRRRRTMSANSANSAKRPAVTGSRAYAVVCAECTAVHELPAYRCDHCAGPLVLRMAAVAAGGVHPGDGSGVWRYGGLLPTTRHAVTLGEGGTPLLHAPWLAANGGSVHLKLESLNPTLSFKDRAMALAVSMALDLDMSGLVLASTGNAAVSAAAYAAAAGLRCKLYCGRQSQAAGKLAIATSHGAGVHVVDGDFSTAYQAAATAEGEGWFNVTTTYRNPVLTEAYRGLACELVTDLGRAPDAVVVPVGAGPLLTGVSAGFGDLLAANAIGRVPRMIGVQAAACAPLARAWAADDWASSLASPIPSEPTVAGAIADSLRGYEREGLLTLAAVRDSGGCMTAVPEETILEAARALAARGIAAEPAAAASVASVRELAEPGASVVALVTGHAAKEAFDDRLGQQG